MSSISVSETLLDEVKNYLDITWEDQDADRKLTGQIERGIAYLCAKTGVTASAFDSQGDKYNQRAVELLYNYVLYDRAGALNQFKDAYLPDIIGLHIVWEVANAPESED